MIDLFTAPPPNGWQVSIELSDLFNDADSAESFKQGARNIATG